MREQEMIHLFLNLSPILSSKLVQQGEPSTHAANTACFALPLCNLVSLRYTRPMPHPPKASKKTNIDEGEKRLDWVRATVFSIVPSAVETISYGIPTFDVGGKHLVHAAVYAKHLGFYPSPATIAHFSKDLLPYVHAKGSVQFPHALPLPKTLIQKMIRFRLRALRTSNNI